RFTGIQGPSEPEPRKTYTVPPNIAPIISIAADKEATGSSFRLYVKRPVRPLRSFADYRALLVESLYHSMLQSRLDEIARRSDSPFLSAYSGQGRIVRTLEAVVLGGAAKEGKITESLDTVLTEVERVKRFGFTESELAREKRNTLTAIEQSYRERENRQSSSLASEYIRYFLEDEASPGIEFEYGLYQRFIPTITLDEINRLSDYLFPAENRVLTIGLPEKPGLSVPTERGLLALFDNVKKKTLEPYRDDVSDLPLISNPPAPGSVTGTNTIPEAGITEWRLSNGARVLFKPTDFKTDEIIFQAFSPGGVSVVDDANFIPAITAADLVNMSGVGVFSKTELEKKLAGKDVQLGVWIDELQEGMSGASRTADFDTLCKLIYLYFTAPKIEPDVFLAYRDQLQTMLKERSSSPENVFSDTLQIVLANNHLRAQPLTLDILPKLDREASVRIFQNRFADAGDFTFVFTGNVTPDAVKSLIETYIASLPSLKRHESWKDQGITRPKGIVTKTVTMGKDPKSTVAVVFHDSFTWRLPTVVALRALSETVEMRLTDVIREEAGGTYGIGVWDYPRRVPRQEYLFFITFGTDPSRVDELTTQIFQELSKLATEGPTADETAKVKEILIKERELQLKSNSFWAALIRNYTLYGESPARILEYAGYIRELNGDAIRDAARQYLDQKQYVKVVLMPENTPGPAKGN
ncbi:MAG TPA: insulinase family protein, partial [Spirochaetia bacterium]|nr:insulinase family protein [Spirochaetia bacterium]